MSTKCVAGLIYNYTVPLPQDHCEISLSSLEGATHTNGLIFMEGANLQAGVSISLQSSGFSRVEHVVSFVAMTFHLRSA